MKEVYQLVVITYPHGKVDVWHPQLLWSEEIGDGAALKEFDNSVLEWKIEAFVAHNFALDAHLVIYYYITGINDAAHPFYYGIVADCLQSPYTRQTSTPRFGDRVDQTLTRREREDIKPLTKSSTASVKAVDAEEPAEVLDALMAEKRKQRGDEHESK